MQNDARAAARLTQARSPHAEQHSRSSSLNQASMSSLENASRTPPRYAGSLRTPMGRKDVFVAPPVLPRRVTRSLERAISRSPFRGIDSGAGMGAEAATPSRAYSVS